MPTLNLPVTIAREAILLTNLVGNLQPKKWDSVGIALHGQMVQNQCTKLILISLALG